MDNVKNEIIKANTRYSDSIPYETGLPAAPVKKTAILTCMDARMNVYSLTGLSAGDAHIIRNAGGRASDDAIRSLVVSHKLLGTTEWFVIQHTDCGMASFHNDIMGKLLEESLETAILDRGEWKNQQGGTGSDEGKKVDWLCISDPEQSVRDDVRKINEHPLVSDTVKVYGFLYEIATGRLTEIC